MRNQWGNVSLTSNKKTLNHNYLFNFIYYVSVGHTTKCVFDKMHLPCFILKSWLPLQFTKNTKIH